MQGLRLVGLLLLAGISASVSESEVCACAPVPHAGESVHIAEESAFIVWDAANKTEHFIRRAKFDTKAVDFGFLVPTPTRPMLSEVDDAVFGYLLDLTKPPELPVVPPAAAVAAERVAAAKSASAAPVVSVLETVTIAGFDAAVLASYDAQALNDWLRKNAYASSPELTEWFKPYIAGKWIITAFKISKGTSSAQRAVTAAVRMSFKTDRPFFPYREPATRNSAPRALEVYFLSGERVEGRIGGAATAPENLLERAGALLGVGRHAGSKWPGRTLWTQPLPEGLRKNLMERVKLPMNAVPQRVWLTRFLDSSAPRPGTDEVYFSGAKEQVAFLDADALRAELGRKTDAARVEVSSRAAVELPARATVELPASEAAYRLLLKEGMTAEGKGDAKAAIKLYRQAYRNGSGEAAKRIGDIYVDGKGNVPRDYVESMVWYGRAEKRRVKVDRAQAR